MLYRQCTAARRKVLEGPRTCMRNSLEFRLGVHSYHTQLRKLRLLGHLNLFSTGLMM